MYKNIIFDLYGTLVDIRTDEDMQQLWDKMALLYGYKGAVYSGDELREAYQKFVEEEKQAVHAEHRSYEYIDIPIENVFRKLFTTKGVKVNDATVRDIAAAFRSISTIHIGLYDGVLELLEYLKESGRKIYLLSNAQRAFTLNEMKMLDIVKYFDGIFISSEHKISKPDVVFFDKIISHYHMDKKETIMIGNDYMSDMNGAYAAGIEGIYIHQDISSPFEGEVQAKYAVMDGDVHKITEYIKNEL